MSRVALDNITKRFGDGTQAVANLSLSVGDGEFVVLLGPSGCGKSTVLRMIAGLEQPSSGEIRMDETVVNNMSPQQRNVAMVFQNYALYPHMSVRENLAFPLKMRHLPRRDIERRVLETAERLSLGKLLNRLPGSLSGGQRQRVAMGRALVREPGVFLMDEPLSNLDAELRQRIRQDIAQLQRDTAITTIYVTHDQVEAMTLGQRIAVLRQGVLQQLGDVHELYARPANVFVAGFIGNPGMNIFEARLQHDGDGYALLIDGRSFDLRDCCYLDAQLAPFAGKTLRAGIRPEALYLTEGVGANDHVFTATLSGVERLGHEVIVHFPAFNRGRNLQTLHSARLAHRENLRIGDNVNLSCMAENLYLFDAEGNAVVRGHR